MKFYRNTVCYCETKSLCQWLPFSGELSSGCETERLCLRRECKLLFLAALLDDQSHSTTSHNGQHQHVRSIVEDNAGVNVVVA